MKAYSSLTVNFGLLNFEVKLYPMRDKTDKIDFKGLSDCCRKETGLKRICKSCLSELSWKTELKGYKIGKNTFVELTKEELDTIERLDNGIEILYFSKIGNIPLSCLDKPYFLEPEDVKINKKIYSLFNGLFAVQNSVAVVKATIKGHEHFGILRHDKKGIVLQFIEKITPLSIDIESLECSEAEIKQISQIAEQNSKDFTFDGLKNTYADKVKELIEAKSQGKVIEVISKDVEPLEDTKLIDALSLMANKKMVIQ